MRDIIHPQIQLGALDIGSIKLDLKSRGDIPQILLGLNTVQHAVFGLLSQGAIRAADWVMGEIPQVYGQMANSRSNLEEKVIVDREMFQFNDFVPYSALSKTD